MLIETWTAEKTEAFETFKRLNPSVMDLATRYPPNRLYLMRSTGERVTIAAYNEDQTMTVAVTGEYNRVLFNRYEKGVPSSDLVETDLPGAIEPLGSILNTPAEIAAHFQRVRDAERAQVGRRPS